MNLLFIYFFLALGLSFICSLLESVLLSISPAFVAVAVKEKKSYGPLLQELKDKVDRPITAILTLNTIAHTVGAAGVGAQVQVVFGDGFTAIASALLTLAILIFSEIIPKTLGAANWKMLAPACAYATKALIFSIYPLVVLFESLSKVFARDEDENSVTREEMIVTAEMGVLEGILRPKESMIIRNLLMLDAVKIADIMTPRSVITAFEAQETVEHVMNKNRPIRFSRIPVYDRDLDHVLGMVHRYKILEAYSNDEDKRKISELMTPIQSVPENISVAAALDQFIRKKEHVFVVTDDYGSTAGLVSLEDAIETLLGVEIIDEFDSVADLRQYALEKWKERKGR